MRRRLEKNRKTLGFVGATNGPMVRQSIYRTAEGREAVLRVHDRAMEALGPELASRTVETRFGRTNLLAMILIAAGGRP